jgi:prolyl-tRNA synthetase
MRLTQLLGKTLRQPPSDAHLPSHQLLVRAGFVRAVEPGLFAHLPLGHRAIQKLQTLVQRVLVQSGGQELSMPTQASTPTAETLVRTVRREIDSYRQLPTLAFYRADQPPGEIATKGGLFAAGQRARMYIHQFGSSDQVSDRGLSDTMTPIWDACGIEAFIAGAGERGSQACVSHPTGDLEIARCPSCSYAAERSWATTTWPDASDEEEAPTEEIATPGCDTIATLAEFLGIPATKTLKMVFYSVEGKVTCVVVRGDRQVDEAKLARVLGTTWYYVSLEHELEGIGAVGGYASPIGLDANRVRVVADPSVRSGKNFVSGANRPDFHIQNVNVPRDFVPGEWADLALVEAGDPCPHCGDPIVIETGFAVAYYSVAAPCQPEAEYLDATGKGRPLWAASAELDLSRLLAAIAETHNDDYGLIWPLACAPVDVHLVALDIRKQGVAEQADKLYKDLTARGLQVLYDDRDSSAGVKFNDADLIGAPLRLTVSKRSVKESLVEAKWRNSRDRLKLDHEGLEVELARLES